MRGIVDIDRFNKGSVITAHSAITATATSTPINCIGKNAILVKVTITGGANNWTFKPIGSFTRNGTYVDCYEQANTGVMILMSYQCNASRMFLFKGIPDWVEIVATENVDGSTVTVEVQPCIV